MRHPSAMRASMLGVLLLCFATLAAGADYRDSYAKGIAAVDRKDWTGASRAFQEAIAANPKEGGRILLYGVRYSSYLPHYQLGVALSKLGDCDGALREWRESENQAAIRSLSDYKDLLRARSDCETKIAGSAPRPVAAATQPPAVAAVLPTPTSRPAAPPLMAQKTEPTPAAVPARATAVPAREIARARADAEAEIQRAQRSAGMLTSLRDQPAARPLWQADAGFSRKEISARKALETAQTLLAASVKSNDVAGLGRSRQMAADAAAQFTVLQKGLGDRMEQARLQRENEDRLAAARDLEARRGEARALLAQLPRAAASSELGKARAELQAFLTRADGAAPEGSADRLRQFSSALVNSIASARRLARPSPPPSELVEGASAYFRGDYSNASRILGSKTFADPRAAAQARLFLAASRYGAYLLAGARDAKLRDQAASDVRECARLDTSLSLNARAFSPRFVEFFRKERG